MDYQTQFLEACREEDFNTVELLLADKRALAASSEVDNNLAIGLASRNGHLEIVKLLLSDERALAVSPEANDNYAIRYASENGHTEIVKLLLADKRALAASPEADNNYAIKWASGNGHTEEVKLLLQLEKSIFIYWCLLQSQDMVLPEIKEIIFNLYLEKINVDYLNMYNLLTIK